MKKCTVLRTASIVFMIILSEGAFSQANSEGIRSGWSEGFIQLIDNSVRKGFIQYNHTLRLIKFKGNLNDVDELSFHEKRILALEYFDATESRKRRFYTLNVREEDSGFTGPVLFEIMMEMKAFVVVSRLYTVQPSGRGSSLKRKNQRELQETDNQLERIYIVDQHGSVELLATMPVVRKIKSKPVARPVEPFFDHAVLKKFTGSKWQVVKAHVKEKRLHLKKKPDLFKALEFYQQIERVE